MKFQETENFKILSKLLNHYSNVADIVNLEDRENFPRIFVLLEPTSQRTILNQILVWKNSLHTIATLGRIFEELSSSPKLLDSLLNSIQKKLNELEDVISQKVASSLDDINSLDIYSKFFESSRSSLGIFMCCVVSQ